MPACERCGARQVVARCCEHLASGIASYDPEQNGETLTCTACGRDRARHPICGDCRKAVLAHNVAVADWRYPYGFAERQSYFRIFEIDRPKLLAFGPGDLVKVALSKIPLSVPKWIESPWVLVLKRDGDQVTGSVENELELFTPDELRHGSVVEFRAENVLDVAPGKKLVERPHSCPRCVGEGRKLEDFERNVLGDVRKYGVSIMRIMADEEGPAFTYTLGLHHRFEHPEVIAFGLDVNTAHHVLNRLTAAVAEKRELDLDGLLEGTRCQLSKPSSATVQKDYFGFGCWFYQDRNFPVRQLTWAGCEPVL